MDFGSQELPFLNEPGDQLPEDALMPAEQLQVLLVAPANNAQDVPLHLELRSFRGGGEKVPFWAP